MIESVMEHLGVNGGMVSYNCSLGIVFKVLLIL